MMLASELNEQGNCKGNKKKATKQARGKIELRFMRLQQ
jgi:hypothetical protein